MGETRVKKLSWFSVASFLAFTCFFASMPIYSPNVVALSPENAAGITNVFTPVILVCAICVCALVAIAETLPPAHKARALVDTLFGGEEQAGGVGAAKAFNVACAVLYLLGSAGNVVLLFFEDAGSVGSALAAICAIIAGLGLLPLCVLWARLFRGRGLRSLLLTAAGSIALAAVINTLFALAGAAPARIARIVLLAIGSGYPLLTLRQPTEEGATDAPASAPQQQALGWFGAFCSVMGTSLLGMGLSSFVIGISPTSVVAGSIDTQVFGVVMAFAVTLALLASHGRTPAGTLVRCLLVPIAAAVALGVCALPTTSSNLGLAASYSLFSLVGVVALATGCGISNAREFSRPFVFASLLGTYCLTARLGLFAGTVVDDTALQHADIVVVLGAAYGVLSIALACRECVVGGPFVLDDPALDGELGAGADSAKDGTRKGASDGASSARPNARGRREFRDSRSSEAAHGGRPVRPSQAAQATAPSPVDLANRLSERYGLTAREAEIARILARGHGCTYVAETLLISKSTVYTHVRNMYRKLNISSHDEFISLLDQQA